MAFLIKYAFKSPKEQDVIISSQNDSQEEDELQNKIRAIYESKNGGFRGRRFEYFRV